MPKSIMNKELNAFEKWMVRSNLKYIEAEGLETVVTRLRANGYYRVADAVSKLYLRKS